MEIMKTTALTCCNTLQSPVILAMEMMKRLVFVPVFEDHREDLFIYPPLFLLRAFTQFTGISLSPLLKRRWSTARWRRRKTRRSFHLSETLRVTMIL